MNCGKVQIISLLIIKLHPANNNIKKERRENEFCLWKYVFSNGLTEMKHQSHESPLHTHATVILVDLGSQALFKIFWKSQCFCVINFFKSGFGIVF